MDLATQSPKRHYGAYVVYGFLFLGMVFYASYVFAHASGMTGVTRKNGNGCTCHGTSPTTGVNVTIDGPAELSPNQTGNYTVTVQGGPAVRAGTDIAVSAGTLNASSPLQKVGDELTHVSPQPFTGGLATFSFSYTAPATPGTYTIYANANSVNFNGANSGDQWNFAPNKTVTVKAATAVENVSTIPNEFSLSQNYPNPFNPSTTISYQVMRSGHISLRVYDVRGGLVSTLVDDQREPGTYKTSLHADRLPSGVYYYRLAADGVVIQSKKMTLLK
ncbi:MAG: T9SS type A sorting domain-containing protein [Ignavibacteriales bacterium]|nr:T9SS type A sorting domain-containing protein [Ignavibacteriales bacterium]